jgi:uncharacterized protein (TIGR02466 family)
MARIHAIFPTLISTENLIEHFGNEHQVMYKKALEYKQKYPSKKRWNCYTTSGYDLLLDESLFEKLIQKCTEKVQKFSENFRNEKKVICEDAWLNINDTNNTQEIHIHESTDFSAVYYIKVNKCSGMIQFILPSEMFGRKCIGNEKTRETYEPHEGDLIIFRSNVPHRVMQNNSKEDRVSLAMNFMLK